MAIAAGIIAAVLVPRDGPIPTAIGTTIQGGAGDLDPPEPPDPIPPPPAPKPKTTKPHRPSDRSVRRALHNLQRHFDRCAREHGGLVRADITLHPNP